MIRRDGNTTRTIDHAIQVLFKTGAIKVPKTLKKEESCSWYDEQLIYDPACKFADVSILRIQQDVLMRIKRRLEAEHKGVNFEFKNNIIKIRK